MKALQIVLITSSCLLVFLSVIEALDIYNAQSELSGFLYLLGYLIPAMIATALRSHFFRYWAVLISTLLTGISIYTINVDIKTDWLDLQCTNFIECKKAGICMGITPCICSDSINQHMK